MLIRKQFARLLYFLLCWQIVGGIVAAAETATFKERYAIFDAQINAIVFKDITDAEKHDAIVAAFQQFSPEPITLASIKGLAVDELNILQRALSATVFYARASRHAAQMALVSEALIAKKTITPQHIEEQYEAFVRTRLFDEARRWHMQYPAAAKTALPIMVDDTSIKSGEASEWIISPDKRQITRRRVDLSQDWMMVVVSHQSCGFSRRATNAIYSDATRLKRLKARAKWVTPQDGSIQIDVLQKWNKENIEAPVSVVHIASEWPFEKFSSTPIFYFLKAGKVVESFSGWPKEGNFEKLDAALDRLALVGVR